MKYKVIDLFAGVGGMSLGFEMAGFDVVLANEYDKDIATAYKKNHSSTKMINEDITKLDLQSVFEQYKGNIDVIIGGPPCQGFSQKGKRKTIHDERNFLFKYYVKDMHQKENSYIKAFESKVIMYLFEDVMKMRPENIFIGHHKKNGKMIFSEICKAFEQDGEGIFGIEDLENI